MGLFDDAIAEASTLVAARKKTDAAKEITQDLTPLQEGNRAIATMPAPEPSFAGAMGTAFKEGLVTELPKAAQGMVAAGGRLLQDTGIAPVVGKKIEQAGVAGKEAVEAIERNDISSMPVYDPREHPVKSAFEQAARMAPVSMIPAATFAVNPALGVATTAALFGGSQAQESYDNVKDALIKQGVSPEEAHKRATAAGYKAGAIETLGESLGGAVLGGFLSAGGRIGSKVLAGTVKTATKTGADVLKEIANPKMLKQFGKHIGEAMITEPVTEFGQAYGERAVEEVEGVPGEAALKAGKEAIGPAVAMTLLFGPFGAAGHYAANKQIKSLRDTLADPAKSMEARAAAAESVAEQIEQVDPSQATNWRQNAAFSIDRDLPITFDQSSLGPVIDRIRANGPDFTLQGQPYDQAEDINRVQPIDQVPPSVSSAGNLPVVAPESRPAVPVAEDRVDASYGPGDPNYQIYGFPYGPEPRGPLSRAVQSLQSQAPQQPVLTPSVKTLPAAAPIPKNPIAKAAQHAALPAPIAQGAQPTLGAGPTEQAPSPASLRPDLMPSEGNKIPAHIERAVAEPRTVPAAVAVQTKQFTKDTLTEKMKEGLIRPGQPVRLTTVDEIRDIIKKKALSEGKDFEGKSGISAQSLMPNTPIVGYGANDKISAAIVFPADSVQGKGQQPNEVKIDSATMIKNLRFVIDGYRELMTYEELEKIINAQEAKNAETVRGNERQVRKGSAEGQPEVQRGAEQGGGNLQQQVSEVPGNGKEKGSPVSGENAGEIKEDLRFDDRLRSDFQALIDQGKYDAAFDLVYTDELTGLNNQKGWLRLEKEGVLNDIAQGKSDLVKFKYLNDTYGDAFGDNVLAVSAKYLKQQPNVKAFRIGGDETAVVSVRDNVQDVIDAYENANRLLQVHEFSGRKKDGVLYTIQGASLIYGTGRTPQEAYNARRATKESLIKSGQYSDERGAKPKNLMERSSEESSRTTPNKEVTTGVTPENITINDIPIDLEITVTAIREKTGRKFKIKENAREAFARVQSEMDAFQEVLKCLGA